MLTIEKEAAHLWMAIPKSSPKTYSLVALTPSARPSNKEWTLRAIKRITGVSQLFELKSM